MLFRDVIGQEAAKKLLLRDAQNGRMAHALLLCGPEGSGKMPLALALASYVCCHYPTPTDACGVCPACVKSGKLVHPDIHFAFPIVKRKGGRDAVCDDYLPQWRNMLQTDPYITYQRWIDALDAGNQQPRIFASESNEIQRKLSFKSVEAPYKVMIIWLPEKMMAECANKLLKLLEEPPGHTLFILVSEEPDALLPTLISRTQRVILRPIEEEVLDAYLQQKYALSPADAADVARRSGGSLVAALENIRLGDEHRLCFDSFTGLMRLAWQRDIRSLKEWSEQNAAGGREAQKHFLDYCQRMTRESFMANFHLPELVYMGTDEQQFTTRFSPFVNERNVMGISAAFEEAQRHIEQNVNPKMVFFDLALQMIMLLKTK